ncbi:TrbC/VirB2 family protein [Acidithiobacillus ferrooxidans]|uniref:TrbC/VirB2 family protein n=1 Tax=Acidithiobacillus ferrooxidans TaxID=920 RepID=UPI000A62DDB6|nr:TrbC/VirB2 family protein [Acidithiobacillus ferrooxidans]
MKMKLKQFKKVLAGAGLSIMGTGAALASSGGGSGMPWDGPLTNIQQDLSGTVAHVFIIVAIVATGLMWAFGEHGSSMRKVMGIAAGGSMALGGVSVVSDLTGSSGAVIGMAHPFLHLLGV